MFQGKISIIRPFLFGSFNPSGPVVTHELALASFISLSVIRALNQILCNDFDLVDGFSLIFGSTVF